MNILVVNINNDRMTRELMVDLSLQTHPYEVTLINNDTNVDLCRIWNEFYSSTTDDLLCFLNNDVKVPPNFVSDTVAVFDKEPEVGCVVHRIGNPCEYGDELVYRIPTKKFCQGFDFTLRRDAYTLIPDDLRVFGGDDYLFSNLYLKGWKAAVVLSSPIVHYNARSRKWYKYNRKDEMETYLKYGYEPLPHGAGNVC